MHGDKADALTRLRAAAAPGDCEENKFVGTLMVFASLGQPNSRLALGLGRPSAGESSPGRWTQ